MGDRDRGTHVDLNDQVVDLIDLRAVYSSEPRGINITDVKKKANE